VGVGFGGEVGPKLGGDGVGVGDGPSRNILP